MNITITANGKSHKVNIPTTWADVDFGTFLKIQEVWPDTAKVLSVITGLSAETLERATMPYEKVMAVLEFLKTEKGQGVPKTILGYPVIDNLEFTSIGRFKDCKMVIDSFPKTEEQINVGSLPTEYLRKYIDLVAIFCMTDYHESSDKQKEGFAQIFLNAPCTEVLAVGNFILLKYLKLRLNISDSSPRTNTLLRRFKQAWISLRMRLAFRLRYAMLNARLRTIETSLKDGR